ncbi:TPA: tyrosine-type recombinase/integrase, partial [Staphylococcus aureus]|nr:tyrosine-type recombinase/integrase [Staphylococcus aureus]HBI9321317.1 tyrosine-type recombinase/integrase [Staphylococcus aureus]HDH9956266.1 tyrosine-type recombinase/integrase [Staphylococcus aureus]
GHMKEAIKYAVKFYNYPNEHILNSVTLPKKSKTIEDIEKEEAKMYNYLEMEQVIQIRDFILNDNNMQYRARILVAGAVEVQALTGMRIGELLALQVKDVDLKNKTIAINGTIHRIKCNAG